MKYVQFWFEYTRALSFLSTSVRKEEMVRKAQATHTV